LRKGNLSLLRYPYAELGVAVLLVTGVPVLRRELPQRIGGAKGPAENESYVKEFFGEKAASALTAPTEADSSNAS
jgi:hypothetical protein